MKITDVTIAYLKGQIAAGADVVQLFDSWLGLCSPDQYRDYVAPYTSRIFAALKGLAPTIHFSTGTVHLLDQIAATGCDIVSVDWRLPLDAAWETIGPEKGIQGNLDPATLLAPWDAVASQVDRILAQAGGRPGHVFNLGHGILPETPVGHVEEMIGLIRNSRR